MQQSPGALSAGNVLPVGSAEPGTVAICFVAAALESVRARHLDPDRLLTQVGLSPSLLQVPQARVSAKQYGELWRLVALTLDDEFFGQDSRRMKAGSFAMLVHSVVGCRNLGQALDRSLRFYGLILDDIGGSLVRDEKEATIVLRERVAGAVPRIVRVRVGEPGPILPASGAGSRIAVNIPMVMPFRTALPTDPESSHGISPDIL